MHFTCIFAYVIYNICNHISYAALNNDFQATKSISKCRNGSLLYTRSVDDVNILMKHLTSDNNLILNEDARPCYFCSCSPEGTLDRCIEIRSYLCIYYARIHEVIYSGQLVKKFTNTYNQLLKEMEDTVVDYMTQSGDDLVKLSCIPLLSSYTDCNIDNICSGCKRCACNVHGTWACSLVQFCSRSEEPTEELERAMISSLQHIDPDSLPTTPKPRGNTTITTNTPHYYRDLKSPKDWVSVVVQKLEQPFDPNAVFQTERPGHQNQKILANNDPIIQNLTDIIKTKESELQVYINLKNDFLRDSRLTGETAENIKNSKLNQPTQSSEDYIKITDAPDTSELFKKVAKLKSDVRNVIFDIEDLKNEAKTKNIGYIINSDIDNLVAAMKKYTFRRQQRRFNTRRSGNIKNYKNISKKNPYEMAKYAEVVDTVINDINSLHTDPQTRRLYGKYTADFDLSKIINKLKSAIEKNEKIYKFYDETDFKMIFLKLQQLEVNHFTNLLNEFSTNLEYYERNGTKTQLTEQLSEIFVPIERIFKAKEDNLKIVRDSSSKKISSAEHSSKFKKYLLEQIVKMQNLKPKIITKKELLNVIINNRLNNGRINKRSKRNLRDAFNNLVSSITKFTPRVIQERMRIGKGMDKTEQKTA